MGGLGVGGIKLAIEYQQLVRTFFRTLFLSIIVLTFQPIQMKAQDNFFIELKHLSSTLDSVKKAKNYLEAIKINKKIINILKKNVIQIYLFIYI